MTDMNRRRLLGSIAAVGSTLLISPKTFAQGVSTPHWPKILKIVAPVPAGGGVDAFCRRVGERLSSNLGINVIVNNVNGAAGLLGAKAIANAPGDGATIGYIHSGHLALQAMGSKLDIRGELKPVIGRFVQSHFAIVVNADSPYQTLDALLRAIRAQPGKLSYGTGGVGTPAHISFEKFKTFSPDIDALHVPYKAAIEAVTGLMGKNTDFAISIGSSIINLVQQGKLRALAVVGSNRSAQLPDVPTVAAATGIVGFSHSSWGGFFGPASMTDAYAASLRGALRKIAGEPEFLRFLAGAGTEIFPEESPQTFDAFLSSSLVSDQALMKKLGLTSAT